MCDDCICCVYMSGYVKFVKDSTSEVTSAVFLEDMKVHAHPIFYHLLLALKLQCSIYGKLTRIKQLNSRPVHEVSVEVTWQLYLGHSPSSHMPC